MAALLLSEAPTCVDATPRERASTPIDDAQVNSGSDGRLTRSHAQSTTADAQPEASGSKRAREKRPTNVEGGVVGRAPSRETSVKTKKPGGRRRLGGGNSIRPILSIGMGGEDHEEVSNQGDNEAEDEAKAGSEEDYSPSKRRAHRIR